MAPRSINYSNSVDATRAAGDLYNYTHPDYRYRKPEWNAIRDCMEGERRVKALGQTYLEPLGDNAGASYESYKRRAVFVNMTARTVNGIVGTLFRRKPRVNGFSDALDTAAEKMSPEGQSLNLFAKTITSELAQMGRVGILCDMDANGVNNPYLAYYIAENILSWKTEVIDGKETLVYVLLREIVDELRFLGVAGSTAPTDKAPVVAIQGTAETGPQAVRGNRQTRVAKRTSTDVFNTGQYAVLRAKYRVLALENGEYVQKVYSTYNVRNVETLIEEPLTLKPTRNGYPLNFIPFMIVGTNGPSCKMTRSPILDIANLNLAHYATSAQLEHGRYYTALPIYFVPIGNGEGGGEYTVGPSVVWEVPSGERPGIIEFHGTGLNELAKSLHEKEQHVAQLGGRVMGIGSSRAGSVSPEVATITQANEMSILTMISDAVSDAMTQAVRWWAQWMNVDDKDVANIKVRINRDFATNQLGAREMRSIALLYQSNILPIQEVHRVFQESELIGEEVDLESFIAMLNDELQFPNQPNINAMQEGFADAADRTKEEIAEINAGALTDVAEVQTDTQLEVKKLDNEDADKTRKSQEKTAKSQQAQQDNVSGQALKTSQFENRQPPKVQKAGNAPRAPKKPS